MLASLCGALLLLGGCNYLGFLASMPGQQIDAVYKIENRPTAVLVEDPHNHFGSSANARRIGSHVAFHLESYEAVEQTISQRAVRDLAAQQGEPFHDMALDTIAKELGAEQLIHIYVREVDLSPTPGTGLYRPEAHVEVQLIDAVQSERLFPDSDSLSDRSQRQSGHAVHVEMPHHNAGQPSRDVVNVLARDLAERVGHDVAKLFFRHPEPKFGEDW